jgi:hypothetical protein
MMTNHIQLNPNSICRVLMAIAIFLVIMSFGGQVSLYFIRGNHHLDVLVRLFNINAEMNIPTFFSTFLLLASVLLLAIITLLKRNQKDPYFFHWMILTLGFLWMSTDEAAALHEKFVKPVRSLLGEGYLGLLYYAWVIPGILLVLVITLYFYRFLLHLPTQTRFNFLIAATTYLGGAIGFESIGGCYAELHGERDLTYNAIATIEEGLEMTGVILFIRALLGYISSNHHVVQFELTRIKGNETSNL